MSTIKLFDSHCHLEDEAYEKDRDEVIKRMHTYGVATALIAGTTLRRSGFAVSLAESFPGLFASVGIHPHSAKDCSETALKKLIKLAENPKVLAWGEIGLDFNRMYSPKKDQEKWLIRQLEIADELNLPIIFHERNSKGRLLKILKMQFKKRLHGVIHCFSGNKSELFKYLDLGLYIGITGIVTIKKRGADLRNLVPMIPEDRILIETDAPYLTPAPEKNNTRRNEPAFVRSVLLKVAEVRRETPEYLSSVIWDNTCRFYKVETKSEFS